MRRTNIYLYLVLGMITAYTRLATDLRTCYITSSSSEAFSERPHKYIYITWITAIILYYSSTSTTESSDTMSLVQI